ncbi:MULTISPECIES: WecB/TagA/CpsF family glycosyltransferase [Micrococcaceae]|jgi:N-acetylglucosaminyldiphosphoundecaprenol N-acetyl-beta-D-mannosaminyltransferase|uniref:Glycosyl transferase, WecB/TagA/CpsF family protein n=1 Tax=Paenarthrobacter aurescens (strain TC1) TaxID=290340 RepID=A1R7W2_PAEAT|nr:MULTISPECIES: WecB/TagA/CpsF family glycosyltransferase [Micrococcaceae]ABM06843.1 putative glycosyl transferase, WecB/TagA/CpsF family protein [Paenarthrobacter aurescens TC1]AFR29650.1 putative glycosyl transferase, WecB/TagA/CpsF family protein [Arthrobacter sp. Rue61a]MBP2265288.1 N-acetylglucosaminyldiphosphoundecaprenol N-acetyl-beta-D-mannosaminyltransferase [Pseudarthrobacter sp. PvP004]
MIPERQRVPVLDVDATPLRVNELIEAMGGLIASGTTATVLGHNLHSITLLHSRPDVRSLYEGSPIVLLDGAPVAMLWGFAHKRQLQPLGEGTMAYRLGSMDWIPELGKVEGLERVAVVGAGRAANTTAVARLRAIVPGATVDGMPGEGWDSALEDAVVDWLTDFRPQLVLIGLGMPLQETVLHRRLPELPPALYCAVGGAIEQVAGIQKLAPRWLGRLGLEWAWRLVLHPGRVAYRVFVEPWKLAGLLIRRRFQPSKTKGK